MDQKRHIKSIQGGEHDEKVGMTWDECLQSGLFTKYAGCNLPVKTCKISNSPKLIVQYHQLDLS